LGDNVVLPPPPPTRSAIGIDFFPLTVDYREYTYAGGASRSSFKREGRMSDREVLTSRPIDPPR